MTINQRLGAWLAEGGTHFAVWSDKAQAVSVNWRDETSGTSGSINLARSAADVHLFNGFARGVAAGALYDLVLDGQGVVDPYARELPNGVHGPARVVSDSAGTRPAKRQIQLEAGESFYELHVGAFTKEGTFAAASEHMRRLFKLGVTVIELMPIAAFAGARGWGYDGVGLFATYAPYGTVQDLRELIDVAHRVGLSVILDVVYNHLGPDGNYLPAFSDAYFDSEHENPWGRAPAFDNDAYRRFVIDNARYWLKEVGFDGLRLDATHQIEPGGTPHLIEALAEVAHSCSPPAALIAEDDRNDPETLFRYGVDAVWSDDFHHCVHVLLTSEQDGYYAGYEGSLSELARVVERGQLYEGQVFPPTKQPRGTALGPVPRERLIYAIQNHDQVGNRAFGERLHQLCDPARLRPVIALSLLLPMTPLLFMGQEWADEAPFRYFADQAGPLGEAVTKGRKDEFAHFAAFGNGVTKEVPDPQRESSFLQSKLRGPSESPLARGMLDLHGELLHLRREDVVLRGGAWLRAGVQRGVLWVTAASPAGCRLILMNLASEVVLDTVADISSQHCRLLWSTQGGRSHGASPIRLAANTCSLFSVTRVGRG